MTIEKTCHELPGAVSYVNMLCYSDCMLSEDPCP